MRRSLDDVAGATWAALGRGAGGRWRRPRCTSRWSPAPCARVPCSTPAWWGGAHTVPVYPYTLAAYCSLAAPRYPSPLNLTDTGPGVGPGMRMRRACTGTLVHDEQTVGLR